MKIIKLVLIVSIIACATLAHAQSTSTNDIEQITETLIDYIEGSTNGQPNRLKKAFHKDLNLYAVKDEKLTIWSGESYIKDTKKGVPTGETGKIISIDFEHNIAVAKVQISHPESKSPYVDYFMLLKLEAGWKIIHKMYTKRIR